MKAFTAQTLSPATSDRAFAFVRQVGIVIAASLFVALCARMTLPLPFTPVPLTLQNFGVLLVGVVLGSRRGFAALALYLVEGATGLPVFNPTGLGGLAQLLGPTGGYLMAYPVVAFVAGWMWERGRKHFTRALISTIAAELLLFAAGISWMVIMLHVPFARAAQFGLYPFVFAEVLKVMCAAALATRFHAGHRNQS
jgi:biotin transport system substrate-specific component